MKHNNFCITCKSANSSYCGDCFKDSVGGIPNWYNPFRCSDCEHYSECQKTKNVDATWTFHDCEFTPNRFKLNIILSQIIHNKITLAFSITIGITYAAYLIILQIHETNKFEQRSKAPLNPTVRTKIVPVLEDKIEPVYTVTNAKIKYLINTMK